MSKKKEEIDEIRLRKYEKYDIGAWKASEL